ncbi:hypothetical protein V8F20_001144 [Naviculisporaceae sp. PSN 640]
MLRSALKPTTTARYDGHSSEEDIGSDSSTGLSNNSWAQFKPRWATERESASKSSDRGRTKSPTPSRRVRFIHVVPPSRPRSATRCSYSDEATWGTLFDSRGRETERMEHILKKLAGYIRANWIPYETHVITPEKMFKFYTCYSLETERLPFQDLFCPKTSNKRIAAVYDNLGVDYIQHDGRHSTPGLTRLGFAQFLIKTIRAFPDEEHRRLQMVVKAIPFDIDDNKTPGGGYVRVPRSLPREFLPRAPGAESYQRLLLDSFRKALSRSSGSGSSSDSSSSSRSPREKEHKKSSHHHRHHDSHSRHHTSPSSSPTTTIVNLLAPNNQQEKEKEKKTKKKVRIITPSSSPPPPLLRNPPPIALTSSPEYHSTVKGGAYTHTQQYEPSLLQKYHQHQEIYGYPSTRTIPNYGRTYYGDDAERYYGQGRRENLRYAARPV